MHSSREAFSDLHTQQGFGLALALAFEEAEALPVGLRLGSVERFEAVEGALRGFVS